MSSSVGLVRPLSRLLAGVFAGGRAVGGELVASSGDWQAGVFVGVAGMKGESNGGLGASMGDTGWEA